MNNERGLDHLILEPISCLIFVPRKENVSLHIKECYDVTEDRFWNVKSKYKVFWGNLCAIYGSWGHPYATCGSVVSSHFERFHYQMILDEPNWS